MDNIQRAVTDLGYFLLAPHFDKISEVEVEVKLPHDSFVGFENMLRKHTCLDTPLISNVTLEEPPTNITVVLPTGLKMTIHDKG